MKHLLALLMSTALLAPHSASAITVEELVEGCTSRSEANVAFCIGFISGVAHSMVAARDFMGSPAGQSQGLRVLAACPPPSAGIRGEVEAFIDYMQTKATAEQKQFDATSMVMIVYGERYPCN